MHELVFPSWLLAGHYLSEGTLGKYALFLKTPILLFFLQMLMSQKSRACLFPWWYVWIGLFSQDVILKLFISVWKHKSHKSTHFPLGFNGFSLAAIPTTYQLKEDKWFKVLIFLLPDVKLYYCISSEWGHVIISFWVMAWVKELSLCCDHPFTRASSFPFLVDSFNYFLLPCWEKSILQQFLSTTLSRITTQTYIYQLQ